MFYLIETNKAGHMRKIRKGTKYRMDMAIKTITELRNKDDDRTLTIHNFKNDTEIMEFIRAHNRSKQ